MSTINELMVRRAAAVTELDRLSKRYDEHPAQYLRPLIKANRDLIDALDSRIDRHKKAKSHGDEISSR